MRGTGRVDDLGFVLFRATLRALVLDFDLGLVMGSSEVFATPSAALEAFNDLLKKHGKKQTVANLSLSQTLYDW